MFTLKKKNPRYIFKVYGNEKLETPAVCVFNRFPFKHESFIKFDTLDLDDIEFDFSRLRNGNPAKVELAKKALLREVSSKYIKQVLKNKTDQIDYDLFARECIASFDNFSVDGKEIKTGDDLLSLSFEYRQGVEDVLEDCYNYAVSREEFDQKN